QGLSFREVGTSRLSSCSRFKAAATEGGAQRLLAKQEKPVLKRAHTRDPEGGGRRINAAKLVSQRRYSLARAVRLSGCSNIGNSFAGQRKCHVKRRRCCAVDDVGTDSQPIRQQVRIPDPGLQFWRKRS